MLLPNSFAPGTVFAEHLLTSNGAVRHQFEKHSVVGNKVGERKEAMRPNTCGSGLMSAGDHIVNYTKQINMCRGLEIFHKLFPPVLPVITILSLKNSLPGL